MAESRIKNISKINLDEYPLIKEARTQIERRAQYIYFIVDEAAKHGVDDTFARDALRNFGAWFGKNKYKNMKDKSDLTDLPNFFGTAPGDKVLEQEKIIMTPEHYEIHFTYCPLVSAWQKLGLDDDYIDRLCQIAMCSDYGAVTNLDGIEFELAETIPQGYDHCALHFRKKK